MPIGLQDLSSLEKQKWKEEEMSANQRFVGLNVHRQSVTVAAVDAQQNILLAPKKLSVHRFMAWAQQHLHPEDSLALEATSNAWEFYDQLTQLGTQVKVANTYKLKLITSGRVKTDKQDALVLAKLNAANLLPEIWIPSQAVRELRALVSHRQSLLSDRSAAKNRLHSILHRHNLALPPGNPFSAENIAWWQQLAVSKAEKLCVCHALRQLQQLAELIREVDLEIARLSVQEPWRNQVVLVMQLPGIGLHSAMVILSAIGEIERFPTAKHLVGYSGLSASVRASGQTHRKGGLTKQGRRELRTVLVAIWHVLHKRAVDRHADPAAVARCICTWERNHTLAKFLGVSKAEFIWQELGRLGIDKEMDTVVYGSKSIARP